jgi:hypothetical protein
MMRAEPVAFFTVVVVIVADEVSVVTVSGRLSDVLVVVRGVVVVLFVVFFAVCVVVAVVSFAVGVARAIVGVAGGIVGVSGVIVGVGGGGVPVPCQIVGLNSAITTAMTSSPSKALTPRKLSMNTRTMRKLIKLVVVRRYFICMSSL